MSTTDPPPEELYDLDITPPEFAERATRVCEELAALEHLALSAAGLPPGRTPPPTSVHWQTGMLPADLADQFIQQAKAAASDQHVFKGGAVYCFKCKSSGCDHSQPGTVGEVFMGYLNTGEPIWQEFFNALNALEDERVGQVFDDRPKPMARLIGRKRLIAQQLVGSGRNSMTYRIIAQVIAGYFQVKGERCAVTVQVVENNTRQLHLQLVAPERVQEAFAEAPGDKHNSFYRTFHAIRELRHKINEIIPDWQRSRNSEQRNNVRTRIFSQLRHLMHVIERKGRQGVSRTKHAHDRSKQNRPVHTAIDDVKAAALQDIFLDRARQSIVVMGKRGRAHVFNRDGRHVTTLQLSQDKLDRRIKRKRYMLLEKDEAEHFIAAVKSH